VKVIEIKRDRSLPGWRAVLETVDSFERKLTACWKTAGRRRKPP
jgi:hypothetical protein